ncbi:uncharacterized protein PpBr36_11501 [Pyricularia pennisetigena]|uniref:uncharacterized protein n=1 Tax=Pyricularia pennisetigena TaxID=1578925 RepID=UPI00115364DA|nr:uncharacterized protein PpBr36_11501 [Pyricularia pennisetigena]TLS20219.1 hypothetical protein PpBr36_11501 [Pyricularia pennisetigena]
MSSHTPVPHLPAPLSEDDQTAFKSSAPMEQHLYSTHGSQAAAASQNRQDAATPIHGDLCEIKILYEGPPKCDCCINWVEEYPDDLKGSGGEKADRKAVSIVARMKKSHKEGQVLTLDSIVVQNEPLRRLLGEVFEGYNGITTALKELVFSAPFHPFYFRWRQFSQALQREQAAQSEVLPHAKLLFGLVEKELEGTRATVEDLVRNKVITFDLLWALFEPGSTVVSEMETQDRFFHVYRGVYSSKDGELRFVIHARFVDWDGVEFGFRRQELQLRPFSGTHAITQLGFYPCSFHPRLEEARTRAIQRGLRFYHLAGLHYRSYDGPVIDERRERTIQGRVIIDAATFFQTHLDRDVELGSLADLATLAIDVQDVDTHKGYACYPVPNSFPNRGRDRGPPSAPPLRADIKPLVWEAEDELSDEDLEDGKWFPSILLIVGTLTEWKKKKKEPVSLTEYQLMLCNTRLHVFSLTLKRWVVTLDIDAVQPIAWNDSAFPNLILPGSHKDLVLSFVESHASKRVEFDDVIEGKGLGLIMLLAGSPGTGKTLTAEAVADKLRRPLYVLGAGELGDSGHHVEKKLKSILELIEKWNAVLLLDECDVFLQARTTQAVSHNNVVAVFLR